MKIKGKITQYQDQDFAHEHMGAHKLARIWVMAADQKIAKVFRKSGHSLELIAEIRPGQSILPYYHINKSYFLYQDADINHFVKDLTLWLENAAQKDLFDRLALVMPPHMLGSVRKKLGHHTRIRIITEIHKEFAQLRDTELQSELEKIICI